MLQRLCLFLLALAALPEGSAAAAPDDARQVVRAVIAQEARLYGDISGDVVPCVKVQTDGSTFDDKRWNRKFVKRIILGQDDDALRRRAEESLWLRGWDEPNEIDRAKAVGLETAEAQSLARAAAAIIGGEPVERTLERIEADLLTPPYMLCGERDATPWLELAAPVFNGDLAFVEARFECALCGHGMIYALRRSGAGWKLISQILHWVS